MIVKIAAKLGYSDFVVFAVLSVKFDVAIVVQKNGLFIYYASSSFSNLTEFNFLINLSIYFWIVVADYFEFDAFRVKTALKLHRVLCDVEAFDARLIDARRKNVLAVWRHFHSIAHYGHVKVLYELDSVS